jgi:hypothetical protein
MSLNEALYEQRIKTLEEKVAQLERGAGVGDRQRTGGRPPKPTNLRLSATPGVIAFEWDPPISDVLHYKVQISENSAMTNASEFTTAEARFTFYEGVPGTDYYCRVATVNRSQRSSEFTSVVRGSIGLVEAEMLDTPGNISLTRFIQTSFASAFNLATGSGVDDDEATFGHLSVTCSSDNTIVDVKVSVIGALDTTFGSPAQQNWMRLSLLRRPQGGEDSTVWQVQRDYSYKRGGDGSTGDEEFIAFPPFAEKPGAGDWEYRLKIAIHRGGTNTIVFTPSDIRIVAVTFN